MTTEPTLSVVTIYTREAADPDAARSRRTRSYFTAERHADRHAVDTHLQAMHDGMDPDGWTVTRVQFERLTDAGTYAADHDRSDYLYTLAAEIRRHGHP